MCVFAQKSRRLRSLLNLKSAVAAETQSLCDIPISDEKVLQVIRIDHLRGSNRG